jgi:hypothetical protein
MKKIFNFLAWPIRSFLERRRYKKRIAELRKRDPFIYK